MFFQSSRFILFVLGFYHVYGQEILESPQLTDFGDWGQFENCTEGFLVTGFQLKVEEYRRRPDNTALNAVKLFCGNVIFKTVQEISSSRGPYGRYQKTRYCQQYATGFQLKSQPYLGRNKDDVAAVNLKLICAEGTKILGYKEPASGSHYKNASFTELQLCGEGHALCGIQTQVEPPQGLGDDTALNNLRAKCCPIPGFVPQPVEATTVDEEEVEEAVEITVPSEIVTPEEIVTQAPVEVVTQVPEEVVTQAPEEIVTQVPEEVVTQAPEEIVTQAPEEVVTQAPDEIVTQAPEEIVTQAPEEIVTQAPEEIVTQAPEEIVTQAPEEIVTQAPEEIVTQAPEEIVTQAPEEIVTQAPEEIVTQAPEEIFTQAPEVVTQAPEEIVTLEVIVTLPPDEVVTEPSTVAEVSTESLPESSTAETVSEAVTSDNAPPAN